MRTSPYLAPWTFLAGLASADVLTVDQAGGAQFTNIPPAVAAASDGDTLLVAPGLYSGFTVTKDLRILGSAQGTTRVTGGVVVGFLDAGKVLVLDRLEVRPAGAFPALRVDAGQGVVHAQRCQLTGGVENSVSSVQAESGAVLTSGAVFLTDCSVRGVSDYFCCWAAGGSPGMYIQGAQVALDGCAITGAEGVVTHGTTGARLDGAAGVVFLSGALFASTSTIRGGDGGDAPPAYTCSDPFPNAGSNGGPGLQATSTTATLIGTTLLGGAAGQGGFDYCTGGSAPNGSPGVPFTGPAPVVLGATRRVSRWTSRWWEASSCGGLRVEVELAGEPGDEVFLAWSDAATFQIDPALGGTWLPEMPTIEATSFAVLPASGQATATLDLAALGLGEVAADRFVQAYFVEPGGTPALGTPGSVVVFSRASRYCSASANSTGLPARIEAWGSPSIQAGGLTLTASALPANRFGYFLSSGLQAFTLLPSPSQGALCLDLPIVRHALVDTGAAGQVETGIDLSALPVSAGQTWNFQFWFRDVNPGNTSNTTDGVAVKVCD